MSEKDKYAMRDDAEPTRRRFVKQVTAGAVGLTAGQLLPEAAVAAKKKTDVHENSLQGVAECLTEAREVTVKALPNKALNLSQKARTAPLESEWLASVRDILLRQNTWENMPLIPQEILVAQPQVAEVVNIDPSQNMPVDLYSMGYGNFDFNWEDQANNFGCDNNTCSDQFVTSDGGDTSGNSCTGNHCDDQHCGLGTCNPNSCNDHTCSNMTNCSQVAGIGMIEELRSNFTNAFVYELMGYLQIRHPERLATAVQSYVTQNSYDASALARLK